MAFYFIYSEQYTVYNWTTTTKLALGKWVPEFVSIITQCYLVTIITIPVVHTHTHTLVVWMVLLMLLIHVKRVIPQCPLPSSSWFVPRAEQVSQLMHHCGSMLNLCTLVAYCEGVKWVKPAARKQRKRMREREREPSPQFQPLTGFRHRQAI